MTNAHVSALTTGLLTCSCMVRQVRRQFAERPGIMTYAEKPDYARCVTIVATSALKVRPDCPSCSSKVLLALLYTSADGDNALMMTMPHLAMHNAAYTLFTRGYNSLRSSLHTSADGDNAIMMTLPHLAMHNAAYTLFTRGYNPLRSSLHSGCRRWCGRGCLQCCRPVWWG